MGVQATIDELARAIRRPITLEDADGQLVAYSAHEDPVDSVRMETLLRKGASDATIRHLSELGVYRSIDANLGVARVAGIPEIGFSPRIALALRSRGNILGYLWVINCGASNDVSEMLLRASKSLVQMLQKRGTAIDGRHKQRENILADLVRGGQRDVDSLRAAARACGWYGDAPFQVIVVRDRRENQSPQVLKEIAPILAEALPTSLQGALLDDVVVLASGNEIGRVPQVGKEIAEHYRKLCRDVSVGLGGMRDKVALIRNSYVEASDAIVLGVKFHSESGCFDYRTIAPYDLLSCLAACDNHSNYGRDALAKLIAYDELHGSDLFESLEAYLDLYGRRRAAAECLNIHPNTLDYRIRRVQEITGLDPKDPDSRFILHVWTKALRFSRSSAGDR